MKLLKTIILTVLILTALILEQCMNDKVPSYSKYNIIFLHHSTGSAIFEGASKSLHFLGHKIIGEKPEVLKWFDQYNKSNGKTYLVTQQHFPGQKPYGWNNYPFDYYNIWVKHAGDQPYLGEPTLEMLTRKYNMIILKHCFPVGDLKEDSQEADIDSPEKSLENYKLQYLALKQKMLQFPHTKFLIWTGAVRIESETNPETAARAKAFFDWVRNDWDTKDDNIYLFDFENLETDGGMYLKKEYASSSGDSHPGISFSHKTVPLFCQRIVDVIENNGMNTRLTGIHK